MTKNRPNGCAKAVSTSFREPSRNFTYLCWEIPPVRRDLALNWPPQVIHGVELRALLRQPDQLNPQPCRQGLAPLGVVARRLVQQEVQRPAAVALTDQPQELLEVRLAHLRASQDD